MPSTCRSKITRNSGPISLLALGAVPWMLILAYCVATAQDRPNFDRSASGPPVRDPQAIAAVERVLTALGGQAAQLQIRTTSLQGTVETANSAVPGSFLWEDDLSGPKPEFRKELHFGSSTRIFVSGHGSPVASHDGVRRSLMQHTALASPPFYLPGVVLATALRYPHVSIRLIHDDRSPLIHVLTSWDLNPLTAFITPQDWYFDPGTLLPVRVEYRVPNTENASKAEPASLEFSDFRSISGIGVPFRVVSHGPDGQTRVFTVTSAQTNIPFSPSYFEVNGGGQ